MAIDRFYIGLMDNNAGLQTNLKPFAIPDNAFASLMNAYVYRGRVRKRFGSRLINGSVDAGVAQLHSRFRIKVGTTAAVTGDLAATIMPGATWKIGQMFSVESTIFTVYQASGATLTTGVATATYNTVTGSLVITGNTENPLKDVYFYPAEPVMGLITFESPAVNDEPVFGFDTQFAYEYVAGAWTRKGTALWTGSDSQFFYGCNYRGLLDDGYLLFIVNYNAADKINYWDESISAWVNFSPDVNTLAIPTKLLSSRMVVSFKKRLIALNTIEDINGSEFTYVNRIRYCAEGSPIDATSWLEDIPGNGGLIDAPTKEQIISCGFIRDRLIVYFERSTYELVYTSNELTPFVFQKINTELGAESTFSAIPFDKMLLGVGNTGIHGCNGTNVSRIDQKIPNTVFQISNENSGVGRVYGIRDYYTEMAYWTFADALNGTIYPNKVLVFNYITGAWAMNEDSITCFGYYYRQNAATWASSSQTWEQSVETWDSGTEIALFRNVIAGNQQGFVFIIDSDVTRNASVLQINDMVVVGDELYIESENHNLQEGDYVEISNAQGVVGLNTGIYLVYLVDPFNSAFSIKLPLGYSGSYTGGGTIARVSNIDIKTKEYNFYVDQGRNASISKVDFHLDKTVNGEVTVDYFVGSADNTSIVSGGKTTNSGLGTSVLETRPYYVAPHPLAGLEQQQKRLWHPVYLQADGECIQIYIYMSHDQMIEPLIAFSDFQLNAMTFYATPTASRMQ